ncbi:Palmitoleoyl-protein carboxylesterase notum1a [Durusdinium trenchii]|uniref:Palmitoleoyl-protein carboxylesterase notum1a n=1 Tax=Durusdinium trenchii TaxID=1381693 RepID=A0ABP0M3E7_9DINO
MTRPWALILHYLAAGLARPAPRKVLLPPLTVEHFSAKCLDSTSAGFFLREQDPSKWIIMIDGGGLCIDALDCRKRAETDHGSSSQWPATWDPEAVPFSGGEASFANYSQVFVPYCSGDLWLGRDRERRLVIGELQMSGHLILDAVVEHLVNTTTLRTASSVVFAGSSAGGIGVFHHADWITTKLQAAGATLGADGVVVLPMAGLFFPMEWPVLWEEFRWGLEVPVDGFMASWCHLLEESFLHEGCVSAATAAGKPKRECQDVSKILPYIKAQVFMLQNQFDQYQVNHLGFCPVELCNSRTPPKTRAGEYLALLGQRSNETMKDALRQHPHWGLWAPSWFDHTNQLQRDVAARGDLQVSGRSFAEAFRSWQRGEVVQLLAGACDAGPCPLPSVEAVVMVV